MGIDEFQIGFVGKFGYKAEFERVDKLLESESCRQCTFLPICGGGCKYRSWVRFGSLEKRDCPKELLSIIHPIIIENRYRDRISTKYQKMVEFRSKR